MNSAVKEHKEKPLGVRILWAFFVGLRIPTQAKWHYLLLSFSSSQRENNLIIIPTKIGAITAVNSVASIKVPPLYRDSANAKNNYSTVYFLLYSKRGLFAVKRATLAPAEQAVLLTSMAKPLHEMVFLKES